MYLEYFSVLSATLVILIATYEVVSTSKSWNRSLKTSLKLLIYPLLCLFCVTAVFKMVQFARI
ncbi:MAG: hypothetical protein EHM20_00885 [Alphaproteobacteria bacterium]|nr:MAG: hypothetical protein EHM20_00885 [Alphaproteobacteria bacterium]